MVRMPLSTPRRGSGGFRDHGGRAQGRDGGRAQARDHGGRARGRAHGGRAQGRAQASVKVFSSFRPIFDLPTELQKGMNAP